MYYLIQKNVFQDPRYDTIFRVMEELDLEYEQVEFKPRSIEFNVDTKRKDVFVYCSVKLAKVSASFDWKPGSFYGNNHEFEHYSKGYGEHTINHGSFICTLADSIDWAKHSKLFIKPSKDAKVFTGKVFNALEWKDFVYEKLHDPSNERVSESTLIQVSKPHTIIKEARVWVVGEKVVTSSYYKFHGDVPFEETVATEGLDFAQRMAHMYNVADAYVMDIALTLEGWKIMEVNCINSAGFYKGDVKSIVVALEEFYE